MKSPSWREAYCESWRIASVTMLSSAIMPMGMNFFDFRKRKPKKNSRTSSVMSAA